MANVATPQEIIDTSECFACLPLGMADLLWVGILNTMAAVPVDTLMDEGKCYECYGPLTQAQILNLSQLRRWLLSLDPAAETDPQSLVAYAKCYACLGSLSMYDLMSLALLDQIAQAS